MSDATAARPSMALLALCTSQQFTPWCVSLDLAGALWASLTLPGGRVLVVLPGCQETPPLAPLAQWAKAIPFTTAVEMFSRFRAKYPTAVVRGCDQWEEMAGITPQVVGPVE